MIQIKRIFQNHIIKQTPWEIMATQITETRTTPVTNQLSISGIFEPWSTVNWNTSRCETSKIYNVYTKPNFDFDKYDFFLFAHLVTQTRFAKSRVLSLQDHRWYCTNCMRRFRFDTAQKDYTLFNWLYYTHT